MSRRFCRSPARRRIPRPAPIPLRVGGFGGAEGLAAYLARERIDAVVDATHPFAARMSANAVAACRAARTPLVVFTRPPWTREPGDRWIEVATMEDAADALGAQPKTVFLTQGRLQLSAFLRAPQHRYVVRAIDRPAEIDALPGCKLILARGPFSLADELELMERARRGAGDQEQRRARDLRQDRGGAHASNRSRHRAPAGRARSRDARMISTRSMAWIAAHRARPVGARRHHPGPRAVASDEARLARADDDERRHVREARVRFAKRRQVSFSSARPTARAKATGVVRAFSAPHEIERLDDADPASPSMPDCRAR